MEIYNCDRCGATYEKHTQICLCPECEKILDKEIAKKPLPYKGWDGKCPTCGVIFVDRLTNYCRNCGQKLDWSEINGKNQQL